MTFSYSGDLKGVRQSYACRVNTLVRLTQIAWKNNIAVVYLHRNVAIYDVLKDFLKKGNLWLTDTSLL